MLPSPSIPHASGIFLGMEISEVELLFAHTGMCSPLLQAFVPSDADVAGCVSHTRPLVANVLHGCSKTEICTAAVESHPTDMVNFISFGWSYEKGLKGNQAVSSDVRESVSALKAPVACRDGCEIRFIDESELALGEWDPSCTWNRGWLRKYTCDFRVPSCQLSKPRYVRLLRRIERAAPDVDPVMHDDSAPAMTLAGDSGVPAGRIGSRSSKKCIHPAGIREM